ncbi:MAG: hypothetical protein H5T92_07415, partial [Synergistales bacterium]|nr:hypothetical protein [Synergistales bacterium]
YNRERGANPLRLVKAFELYRHPVYQRLAEATGTAKLYILSAGWGLIPASFLTPVYDITFTMQAERYKRRKASQRYADFCMLPAKTAEPIVMFGSKEYAPFFAALTKDINAPKTVFYRSATTPQLPGCRAVRIETSRRTNWQYECAEAFLDRCVEVAPNEAVHEG